MRLELQLEELLEDVKKTRIKREHIKLIEERLAIVKENVRLAQKHGKDLGDFAICQGIFERMLLRSKRKKSARGIIETELAQIKEIKVETAHILLARAP